MLHTAQPTCEQLVLYGQASPAELVGREVARKAAGAVLDVKGSAVLLQVHRAGQQPRLLSQVWTALAT